MALNVGLNSTYPTLSGPLYFFPIILGSGLVAAGLRYGFDQSGTGKTYGIPPSASVSSRQTPAKTGDVYMTVAGIRVFMLGANVLAFALLRDRRGTGIATLVAVAVPIADGVVAFRHAKDRQQSFNLPDKDIRLFEIA
ncbi:hypothetical protein RQP46_005580 [Phenoliferia psychrophenolica]